MKKLLSMMLAIIVASLSATMFAGTPIKRSELPKAAQILPSSVYTSAGYSAHSRASAQLLIF